VEKRYIYSNDPNIHRLIGSRIRVFPLFRGKFTDCGLYFGKRIRAASQLERILRDDRFARLG